MRQLYLDKVPPPARTGKTTEHHRAVVGTVNYIRAGNGPKLGLSHLTFALQAQGVNQVFKSCTPFGLVVAPHSG